MKAKRTILFFLLLSALIPIPLVRADPGWLTGWTKRVKITIDSWDVDTALTDFPILIYISNSSGINGEDVNFVFDEVGANSLKIAVTESDGITECYVEVEKWDLGNEKAWLWAKIPSINNTADTEIYLYYDNAHADNNAHVGITNSTVAENVWESNFEAVMHLAESGDGTANEYKDSTENDKDGQGGSGDGGKTPALVTDVIDGAQDFDGVDNFIDWGNTWGAEVKSVSVWFKWEDTFDENTLTAAALIYRDDIDGVGYEFGFQFDMAGWNFPGALNWVDEQGERVLTSDGDYNSWTGGIWYHAAVSVDGAGNGELYINGAEVDSATGVNTIAARATTLLIGAWTAAARFFEGVVDEVRISSISRNAEWVKASYESGRDDLLDFESEQESPIPYLPTKLFGAGFNASIPYVDLYWESNLTNVDFFEIQNSTDKISWEYLGSNTTAKYHDFEVINGTERYYRVRACNFEYDQWFNSSFTDINFEKVYFVSDGGGLFPGLAIGIALLIIGAIYIAEKRR